MTIAIDIRSLIENRGGIAEYTRSIINALLRENDGNHYILFSAGRCRPAADFSAPHVRAVHIPVPNKVLNACFFLFRFPTVNFLIRRTTGVAIDLFFAPNADFFALDRGTKNVLTLHDLSFAYYSHFLRPKSRAWHALVNFCQKAHDASRIIAVSESTKNDVISSFGIREDRIATIPLGAPAISPVRMHRRSAEERYILAFGIHDTRKNIPFLIEAFGLALSRMPALRDTFLVIAGVPREHLRRARAIARKSERCVVAPFCSRDALARLYARASLCVYPSVYEGFGIPPLEALSAGTPVIAALDSSIGEVVGDSALLIDPYDVESLAHAIEEAMSGDPDATRTPARPSAALGFSWDDAARMTRQIFNDAVCA